MRPERGKPMPLRLVMLLLLILWPVLATARTMAPIGPDAVWHLPVERWTACLQRDRDPAVCLPRLMHATHAAPAVVAVSRALASEGVMSAFQTMGRIDLAIMTFPARANTNAVPYLVNGTPRLVSTELAPNAIDITADPQYPALKAAFPHLEFWPSDATFRSVHSRPDGGQYFVFAYPLRDGCHACALAGYALVSHDFTPADVYQGTLLLGLEPATP